MTTLTKSEKQALAAIRQTKAESFAEGFKDCLNYLEELDYSIGKVGLNTPSRQEYFLEVFESKIAAARENLKRLNLIAGNEPQPVPTARPDALN